ncbi:hypothetical protein [Streptomyces sp. NPDC001889]
MEISAEVQTLHDHFDALGRALAAAFDSKGVEGEGWTHRAAFAHYGALDLLHPCGMGIWLRHEGRTRKGAAGRRLTVGGSYPAGYGGWRAQQITVAMDRDPISMAQDIRRRLFPDYLTTWRAALEEHRKDEENRRARVTLNRRLEQTLPGFSPAGGPSRVEPDRTRSYWSGRRYNTGVHPALAAGHATLSTDAGTVSLRLDYVPAELAVRILGMLNPDPAVEGTIVPRAVAPAVPALPPADRVIRGEVVDSPGTIGSAGARGTGLPPTSPTVC